MKENSLNLSIDHDTLSELFGELDNNIKKIENYYNVTILERNGEIKIIGDEKGIENARKVLLSLEKSIKNKNSITDVDINYMLNLSEENQIDKIDELDKDIVGRTILGKPIKPKTLKQKEYCESIKNNMITFGIGPAGTGKTFLGMCMAVSSFKKDEVKRIILTRPAIEAGEKLGFLPGDLQSKVDPYLRPLYDALYQLMGIDSFNANLEKGLIEVAPLAYMRGRTLDNAFIILDEAQNTTIAQMKMFLTRIGFNSKVIVTGDYTQIDLPKGTESGLIHSMKVLKNIDDIKFVELTSKDVVRHPLVQKIVTAYDKYESKKKNNKK